MALCERRPAEEHEKDFIYALKKIGIYPYVSQIWGWDEAFQYREFEDDWAKRDEFWTLWSENEPVGYVQLAQEGHIVNVVELHIVPQHRRKAWGPKFCRRLLKMNLLMEKGADRLFSAKREPRCVCMSGLALSGRGDKHPFNSDAVRLV